jgi:hypothetical protein
VVLFATSRTVRSRAAPQTVLYLTGGSPLDLDADGIRQAVAIYTRDLHLDVATEALAPAVITSDGLLKVVELVRVRGARLAFWCGADNGEVVLYTVALERDHPEVHALRVARPDDRDLFRSIALKLRAVLMGNALLEPAATVPPVPSPLPRVGAPQAQGRPPIPAAAASPADVRRDSGSAPAERPPRSRPRAIVAVGYRMVLPSSDIGLARQGIAAEIGRPFGPVFELHLGSEMTSEPQKRIAAGAASLLDIPIRLGMRAFRRVGRATVGVGPVVSTHILSVSALGFDGARGDALTAAMGFGGEIVGRVAVTSELSLDLRAMAETIVPTTTFTLHGSPSVEARGVLFSLGVGVAVAVP